MQIVPPRCNHKSRNPKEGCQPKKRLSWDAVEGTHQVGAQATKCNPSLATKIDHCSPKCPNTHRFLTRDKSDLTIRQMWRQACQELSTADRAPSSVQQTQHHNWAESRHHRLRNTGLPESRRMQQTHGQRRFIALWQFSGPSGWYISDVRSVTCARRERSSTHQVLSKAFSKETAERGRRSDGPCEQPSIDKWLHDIDL